MPDATRSPKKLRVMLAESDDDYASGVERTLRPRYDIERSTSLKGVVDHPRRALTDVVLLDLKLRGTSQLDPYVFVKSVCEAYVHAAVIILADDETHRLSVVLRQAGAKDYLVKDEEHTGNIRNRIEEAYALHEAETRRRALSSDSIPAPLDMDALSLDIREAVHEALSKKKTGVGSGPVHRIKAFLNVNWKFILGGAITAAVYLVDFRDQIKSFTSDIEAFQATTTDAIDTNTVAIHQLKSKQESDDKSMRKAVTRARVLSVESTTQLQLEIRAANPKVSYPKDTPALRRAKDQVRELKAGEQVFDGATGDEGKAGG